MDLKETLENKKWLATNRAELRAALPQDWTVPSHDTIMGALFKFKVLGLDWRSADDFSAILASLEVNGVLHRRGTFIRAEPSTPRQHSCIERMANKAWVLFNLGAIMDVLPKTYTHPANIVFSELANDLRTVGFEWENHEEVRRLLKFFQKTNIVELDGVTFRANPNMRVYRKEETPTVDTPVVTE